MQRTESPGRFFPARGQESTDDLPIVQLLQRVVLVHNAEYNASIVSAHRRLTLRGLRPPTGPISSPDRSDPDPNGPDPVGGRSRLLQPDRIRFGLDSPTYVRSESTAHPSLMNSGSWGSGSLIFSGSLGRIFS